MEKQAPLVDLCIYVQKYWKGTRTLSACKSASPHSELLQMKSILLTPLAFIQVTSSARPLLSHKFRVTQLMANPFLTGCQGCQGRSCAQSSPCAALLRDIPWPACSGDHGEGTQPCPVLPPEVTSIPGEQGAFPSCSCFSLHSLWRLGSHPSS